MVKIQAVERTARELSATARRATIRVAQKAVSIARCPVRRYSRWGLYPQGVFIIIALVWFDYCPDWAVQGPSVAMAFLAIAATYMAVRGSDSTRVEGIVWIVITFCLFVVEMRSIIVERKSHDTEQAELRVREETTRREQNQSFKQLIGEGENLFQALREEKTLTQQNLEHITGGNGYCCVVPVSPLPVSLGGDPAHQGNNWWQIALKNSGKVVLPTCDIHLVAFPTDEERRAGISPNPPDIFYHFDKVPIIDRRQYRYTPYFIKGDRIYSGVVQSPTRTFNEAIKFTPDPNDPTRYRRNCSVSEQQSGKILEKDCYPQ